MSEETPEFDINEDIRIAKEWCQPEHLPPGHIPGEGGGWRHTCYRLAKYIETQHKMLLEVIESRETILDGIDQALGVDRKSKLTNEDRKILGLPEKK